MTTSDVKVTPGSGRNVATYSISEDTETKELQRIVNSDSSGSEIEAVVVGQDTMAASLPVVIASDQSAIPVTVGTVTTITNVVHVDDNAGSLTVDGTVAVSGTVTVGSHAVTNAGTFAVQDAAAEASLSVLGDWDETDRAKVNIIVGQAGVAAGAGAVAATVPRVTLASDDPAVATLGATADAAATAGSTGSLSAKLRLVTSQLNTLHTDSANFIAGEYETVAASQTDQSLGATGAAGDYLEAVLIVPGTSAAGAVSIKDGAGSAISIFAGGGTTALADLAPIYVPLGIVSTGGAWKLTTGSNVTAIGIGNFT
jgi:hypothetical protein